MNPIKAATRYFRLRSEWLGAGGEPVSHALASSRASTCLSCPLNQRRCYESLALPVIQWGLHLDRHVRGPNRLDPFTESDLHACAACDCLLRAKVWVPLPHILATTPLEDLHPSCWILREQAESKRAFTLLELLVTITLIALLTTLLLPAASRALTTARAFIARVEFAHFARTVRYLGEPDPRILDADGNAMFYTTNAHFPGYLFTIERD